ncbi:hypothetical protein [Halomonas sp. BMC6]|uniref:hypothetical protein n=1 Tax=Halomonas sp. BMC6 TaxID=3073244 RepID=UPI0030CC64D7
MSAEQDLANANVKISELINEVQRFRDAAMGLNAIYPTITEGRQNTADGKYFSVPGGGAYMRLYRRQGSSAELIAEFPDRAELNSVIAQLGPLLGRGVVGGSGDLMAEGAFGLGGDGSQTHANVTWAEIFSGNGTLNQFFNANNIDVSEIGYSESSVGGWVVNRGARPVAFFFGNANELRSTRWDGANWGPHIRYLSDKDILGTVSQEGGVPTGAIIERGSNANGSYTLFADGFMRCIRTDFTLSQTQSRYNGTWTFPRAFVSTAHVDVVMGFSSGDFDDTATRERISTLGVTGGKTSNATIELYMMSGYSVPAGSQVRNLTLVAEGYAF